MATLETIRTKAGVFITIIIGIALLSFIVNADTLSTAMSIFSSKNDVGKIANQSISYADFDAEVNHFTNLYMIMSQGQGGMNDATLENIREQAWNAFLRRIVFDTEYEKVGLHVSDVELTELMKENSSIRQMFTNPQTGQFDLNALVNAVNQLDSDPNWKAYWMSLEAQTRDNQLMQKYMALTTKSNYVNNMDVERAIASAKSNVNFTYAAKEYSAVADSSIQISKSDLEKFYSNNKLLYDQARARDFDFVSLPIKPQALDFERTLNEIIQVKSEMDTIPVSGLKQFVTFNSETPFDDTYHKKGTLPADIDSFAFSNGIGAVHPFYQVGDAYFVSRISDIRILPDSVRAEHILLGNDNFMKADSIIALLEKGANFAELANQFSLDQTANAKGGDLGWFAFASMVRPFSDSCFYQPKGRFMKVGTQFGLHIVRVTDRKDESKKVQVATVQMTATAGKETREKLFNTASAIARGSKNDGSQFSKLAADNGVQVRREYNVQMGDKKVAEFTNARELVRWVYTAEVGEVSEVLEIDNNGAFVVARLSKIKNAGIAPLAQVKDDVERRVRREKKAELLAGEMKSAVEGGATTIDAVASKTSARVVPSNSSVNFNSAYIPSMMGSEPKLLGAVTAAPENKLAGPIDGENGVYMFVVTYTTANPQVENKEAERMRLQGGKANRLYDFYNVLVDKAKIEDNRGKFF